ncbi:MAG: NAD(P)H-dependent oxidoreductase [bacterium]
MYFFTDHAKKKIVVLLGHPDSGDTHSGQIALLYATAAKKAGHTVRRFNLGDMDFDPILHKGYKEIQVLEPDLKKFQDAVRWADHLVIIYPNWWGTMPALLKGLFDRMWLPGFCFNYFKEGIGGHLHLWKRLMHGKTARVVVLSGTHPTLIWLFFGDYTNEIYKNILWFAGFKTKLTRLGPSEHAPEWKWNEWRRKIIRLGTLGE